MKNVILRTKYMLLALIIVLTFSCSPEDGEIGSQGLAGQDGNANVTSIILRDISLPATSTKTFNVPELTQEILDKGLVVVHINLNTTASHELWSPLPVVLFNEIVKVNQFRVGEIDIRNNSIPLVGHLKFILIEGN
ncbi:MAG: hypothetical protein L3J20_13310 [Flavobacteriaceae bacterium]|nr:hypothetical protein [Flavobacteriaceae bacterium]